MHHKGKRNPQKEGKRLAHKSARAKTKTALDGGHVKVARGDSWSNDIPQPPLVEGDWPRGKPSKKSPPKKERCPVNGTHEWYREWITDKKVSTHGKQGYWNCEECRRLRLTSPFLMFSYCERHTIEVPYEVRTRLDTCIHCWTEKKLVRQPRSWSLYRQANPLPYIPRTAYRKKS